MGLAKLTAVCRMESETHYIPYNTQQEAIRWQQSRRGKGGYLIIDFPGIPTRWS